MQVVLSPNAGLLTGPGTNTYVVGTAPAAVIDPAVADAAYLDELLAAAGGVRTILITHRHPDHVGGVIALAARTGAPVLAFGTDPAGRHAAQEVRDGDLIDAGGTTLEALHTPGHAPDHLCFLLAAEASLFSGDVILGEGTAVISPRDGDMSAYVATLRRLRSLSLRRIYPGHFRALADAGAVIDRYIEHRSEREQAIVEVLTKGPATLDEIVAIVYADTPLPLHRFARHSAGAHLEKLRTEGRARLHDDRWTTKDVE